MNDITFFILISLGLIGAATIFGPVVLGIFEALGVIVKAMFIILIMCMVFVAITKAV